MLEHHNKHKHNYIQKHTNLDVHTQKPNPPLNKKINHINRSFF